MPISPALHAHFIDAGQSGGMTTESALQSLPGEGVILRFAKFAVRTLALLTGGLLVIHAASLVYFEANHPPQRIAIYGPAGEAHSAYIEDRSLDDDRNFVLCAWDWPHTFLSPVVLGPVHQVHWTLDGSMILQRCIRVPGARPDWQAAYDYRTHAAVGNEPAKIEALILSRGGLGPEATGVPAGKESF